MDILCAEAYAIAALTNHNALLTEEGLVLEFDADPGNALSYQTS